jgi:hypothetical protein
LDEMEENTSELIAFMTHIYPVELAGDRPAQVAALRYVGRDASLYGQTQDAPIAAIIRGAHLSWDDVQVILAGSPDIFAAYYVLAWVAAMQPPLTPDQITALWTVTDPGNNFRVSVRSTDTLRLTLVAILSEGNPLQQPVLNAPAIMAHLAGLARHLELVNDQPDLVHVEVRSLTADWIMSKLFKATRGHRYHAGVPDLMHRILVFVAHHFYAGTPAALVQALAAAAEHERPNENEATLVNPITTALLAELIRTTLTPETLPVIAGVGDGWPFVTAHWLPLVTAALAAAGHPPWDAAAKRVYLQRCAAAEHAHRLHELETMDLGSGKAEPGAADQMAQVCDT